MVGGGKRGGEAWKNSPAVGHIDVQFVEFYFSTMS